MPMYYTSKAFIFSLSQACAKETEDTGVVITCLCPGPAATNFEREAQMKTDNRMFTWFGSEKLKRDLSCLVNTGKTSGHILHSCTCYCGCQFFLYQAVQAHISGYGFNEKLPVQF